MTALDTVPFARQSAYDNNLGWAGPVKNRPEPIAFLDDDLDFYDHDHQRYRQEVRMFGSHLFLQVEAGGDIPSAFSFRRAMMNESFMAAGATQVRPNTPQ